MGGYVRLRASAQQSIPSKASITTTITFEFNIKQLRTTSNYEQHTTNNQHAILPQLRRCPRESPPRERKRSLQHHIRHIYANLSTIHPVHLSVIFRHQPFIKEPHQRKQSLEGAQEAPPRDEHRIRRLLQLSIRIEELFHCFIATSEH